MSFYSYHIYGIGVNVDELPIDDTLLVGAIKKSRFAKNIAKEVDKICAKGYNSIEDACDEICMASSNMAPNGVATVIARLIEERNPGLCLIDCRDYDDTRYIVYQPDYSWRMNDFDKLLTREKLCSIFVDFLNTISREEITNDVVDDREIENGG